MIIGTHKPPSSSSPSIYNAIQEFCYQVTYVSPCSNLWFWVLTLCGNLLLLAPALEAVYKETQWDAVATFASYLNVRSYLESWGSVSIFCYVFFAQAQIFSALIAYKLWGLRKRTAITKDQYSFIFQMLHLYILGCSKALFQISVSLLFFALREALDRTTSAYLVALLLLVATAEIFIASLVCIIFCQDRSIRRTTIWAANLWHCEVLELVIALAVHGERVLVDFMPKGVVYLGIALLRSLSIGIFVVSTKFLYYWVDMMNFFWSIFYVATYVMLFGCTMTSTQSDYFLYHVFFFVLSALLCVARTHVSWTLPNFDSPTCDYSETLLSLATKKGYEADAIFSGLLAAHRKNCATPGGCECRHIGKEVCGQRQILKENLQIYITEKDTPEQSKDSVRLLKFLVSTSGGQTRNLILEAEAQFYFFNNFCHALEILGQIEASGPTLVLRQRIYTLRRTIRSGLGLHDSDPQEILASIAYLKYYQRFLDQIEDSTELTIKFWSVLLQQNPSSSELDILGKKLFDSKYKIMSTVETMLSTASNHVEFLVHYGHFMRMVMHDNVAASQALDRIFSITNAFAGSNIQKGFSLFREDVRTMMLVADSSFDCGNNKAASVTVSQMNTTVEQILEYSRKDLMGFSVTRLMPPEIAQRHPQIMQQYFHTLASNNIGNQGHQFVKARSGLYVPCTTFLKLVPKLSAAGGVCFALLMMENKKLAPYASHRPYKMVMKKIGAIFCNAYNLIQGFTKDAVAVLDLGDLAVKDTAGSETSIFSLFPQAEEPEICERMSQKEGAIISFGTAEREELLEETKAKLRLLWVRRTVEKFGPEGRGLTVISFVFSEVNPDFCPTFTQSKELPGIYVRAACKGPETIVCPYGEEQKKEAKNQKEVAAECTLHRSGNTYSDIESVSQSIDNRSASSSKESAYDFTRELQISSMTRQVPSTIKRLLTGILSILVIIIALISVNAYINVTGVKELEDYFDMIKEYQLRYNIILGTMDADRQYAELMLLSNFGYLRNVITHRVRILGRLNHWTRNLFFAHQLYYDSELVTVYNAPSSPSEMSTTFSHALLMFMRANTEFSGYAGKRLSPCKKDMKAEACVAIVEQASFAYDLGYHTLRGKQNEVTVRMEEDLKSLAKDGEKVQYSLMGTCVGLVFAIILATVPVFLKVVRYKSGVLGIFADIKPEEAATIIEKSRRLDIKNLKYKKRWIAESEGKKDAFWEKLEGEQQLSAATLKAVAPGVQNQDKELAKSDTLVITYEEQMAARRKASFQKFDYGLLKSFVARLGIVLLLFGSYIGGIFYFTSYVYRVDEQASEMIILIGKRAVGIMTMSFVLKEAIDSLNKSLVINDPVGKGSVMDIIDESLRIEGVCKDFEKTASRRVFGGYFDTLGQAEGSGLCNVSDSFDDGIRISCDKQYQGPKDQGLSAGIAYVIEAHTMRANSFLSLNVSNATAAVVTRFKKDDPLITINRFVSMSLTNAMAVLMVRFYEDAKGFFAMTLNTIYALTPSFIAVFSALYVFIFVRFIRGLDEEIWRTHGVLNIIPLPILEGNQKVREQVSAHKSIKQHN